jgi:hypothetical protein
MQHLHMRVLSISPDSCGQQREQHACQAVLHYLSCASCLCRAVTSRSCCLLCGLLACPRASQGFTAVAGGAIGPSDIALVACTNL